MSRLTVLFFLISAPAVLVSLPIQHQSPAMRYNLVMMNDQDLWQKSSSSKLVMYDQHHHLQQLHHQVQHQHQTETEFGNVGVGQRPKKPTRSVIPRLDLNLDPSISSGSVSSSSIQATTTTTTSPKISPAKAHSLTDHQQGNRAQSEVQLQFERQHALEVSLEQMLLELENGADGEKEEKQKKAKKRRETKKEKTPKQVGNDGKNNKKSSPAWQKIWYKRQG